MGGPLEWQTGNVVKVTRRGGRVSATVARARRGIARGKIITPYCLGEELIIQSRSELLHVSATM